MAGNAPRVKETYIKREDWHLEGEEGMNWSGWKEALRPSLPDNTIPDGYRIRSSVNNEQQPGLICTKEVENFLDQYRYQYKCGIYEWGAKSRNDLKGNMKVVYIGCSCSSKGRKLKGRIMDYCTSGSHKRQDINYALQQGYTLYVRVKETVNTTQAAEAAENELLQKYNYAWNRRIIKPARSLPNLR
ncbi:Hypothetical predicted protein [Paramuricea clavata]|uniref:Uncharacterized protein n=1 Tax=Paramuricea clavata TaxID=317549 RepID=A0A6S7KGM4_PARCT|nr:Hypothetical predicted protein [Paramuricea clavata]